MAERHQRCHLWPRCAIHTGEIQLASMSHVERMTVAQAYWDGDEPAVIAARHGLNSQQVYRLAKQALNPRRRR